MKQKSKQVKTLVNKI